MALVAASIAVGLGGCGGGESDSAVVARVGGDTITKGTVDHWATVVSRGAAFTGFRGAPRLGTPQQRALAMLISSDWLIGEAARRGVPVSREAVREALEQRMVEVGPGFRGRLAEAGQTLAGVELELKAELALEALHNSLAHRAGRTTQREVASYYDAHTAQFSTLETRVVDLIMNVPTAADATAIVKRVGAGRSFAKLAYRKRITLTPGVLLGPPTKKAVDHAIFEARPGVVSRPMPYNEGWTVFVVRKIIPPRLEPLAKVRRAVVTNLVEQRTRELTAAFEREYTRRWTSATSCHHGYVVLGCVQYHGSPQTLVRFSSGG